MSSSKCTGPIKITGKSCPPQQGDPASAPWCELVEPLQQGDFELVYIPPDDAVAYPMQLLPEKHYFARK